MNSNNKEAKTNNMKNNKGIKPSKKQDVDKKSIDTTMGVAMSEKALLENKVLQLEATVSEQDKYLNQLVSKIEDLDSNIDWENKRPWAKIKRFGLLVFRNWDDVLDIIKLLIALAKKIKAQRAVTI